MCELKFSFPECGLAESHGECMFIFVGKRYAIPQSSSVILHLSPTVNVFSTCSASSPTLCIVGIFNIMHSNSVLWYLIVVMMYVFLMANEYLHVFIFHFLSCAVKYIFKFFAHSLFSYCQVLRVLLYILYTTFFFFRIYDLKIFFFPVCCLFFIFFLIESFIK